MQIDIIARRQLAETLRHLISGVITNDQFEDRLLNSSDEAVVAIYEQAWLLYDDLHEHRLSDKWRIPDESRPIVSRWIAFLHTNLPYEWPAFRLTGFSTIWPAILALLTAGTTSRRAMARFQSAGDFDVWPFFRRNDFEKAIASPVLLRGAAEQDAAANP